MDKVSKKKKETTNIKKKLKVELFGILSDALKGYTSVGTEKKMTKKIKKSSKELSSLITKGKHKLDRVQRKKSA